ncbi:aldehyde oxidase GLOX1-like [Cynara cardunculus var. scolymus]|uniref:aldehyde oxidase GLOX1-like n=1 Tax=Cynara cardunculus var. scolymus TaxID=59895 RepID=UPI000D629C55|nr:aldehyde oxidase GLOX1-like [Cynara cardunculus var. scolymus]
MGSSFKTYILLLLLPQFFPFSSFAVRDIGIVPINHNLIVHVDPLVNPGGNLNVAVDVDPAASNLDDGTIGPNDGGNAALNLIKDGHNAALNLVHEGINAALDLINGGKVNDGGSDYAKPELETNFMGEWKIDCPNAGVGAMQLQLMPNDQVVWFDATTLGPSARKLEPEGNCPPNPDTQNQPDCFAHCIAYDWKTAKSRTIVLSGEPWCSSGNLWPNGNLVATGGTFSGVKAVRMLPMDDLKSDFIERKDALGDFRWYSSNQVLEDGSAVLVGGRESWSIEVVPPTLDFKPKKIDFPFLKETCTPPKGPNRFIENNLYPFVYLLPDGNVFLFANDRSINFNPITGKISCEHPLLPGGARNYPASGMSALFPLKLMPENPLPLNVEVVVCGGNKQDAFERVDAKHVTEKEFVPALKDCHRIHPMKPGAVWEDEQEMPSERCMGDLLHLPTGDLIMLNGAKKGTAAWEDAIDPNFTPILYSPGKPMGKRFKEMNPTTIARMYHSSSALLPDTTILVAGSNPHQFYTFNHEFPTELRVEKFSPHYLDPALDDQRPSICPRQTDKVIKYGAPFKVVVNPLKSKKILEPGDVKVTMIYPPFTTHGFSQNQRLIVLALKAIENNVITAFAPPSGNIAPPGYYMMFVNYLGVPGPGLWVHIDK